MIVCNISQGITVIVFIIADLGITLVSVACRSSSGFCRRVGPFQDLTLDGSTS